MTNEIPEYQVATANMLASMLTENTGRHLLDSGDAYGRNWERNAGKIAQDFYNEPPVSITAYNGRYGYHTLNVFHYLLDRLEYDAERDKEFHEFVADSTAPWLADMEEWLDSHDVEYHTYNSYNGEDALSQVIQWAEWGDDYTDKYILLQIHGGADVRGGYSSGHVFKVTTEAFGYDNADGGISCTNPDCEWSVFIIGGGSDVINREGESVGEGWQGAGIGEDSDLDPRIAHCPECDSVLVGDMPYAS